MKSVPILLILICSVVFLTQCKSTPVIMTNSDVKVLRDEPNKSCKNLGFIEGRSISINSSEEEALNDLKKEATRKGANYVYIQTTGALGTSVRGIAYFCN